ncbi:hypothetical protein K1Y80_39730 [Streptomyces sp. MAG02]|nr:hypothetical protein [Streptomyces sp. MAG02]
MTTGETFRTGGLPGTTHTRQPYPIGVAACELQCRLASKLRDLVAEATSPRKIDIVAIEDRE